MTILSFVFLKEHVKCHDSLNLTCDLSGSNITWCYEGQRTCYIGHVLTLESIMQNASGVYRCNDSTSGENYTVTVECE